MKNSIAAVAIVALSLAAMTTFFSLFLASSSSSSFRKDNSWKEEYSFDPIIDYKQHADVVVFTLNDNTPTGGHGYQLPKKGRKGKNLIYNLHGDIDNDNTLVDSYSEMLLADTTTEFTQYSRVSVVISHCDKNLAWLASYLDDVDVHNITIISKCNVPITDKDILPPDTTLIRLPNVGRCDHSWAFWMAYMYKDLTEEEDDASPSIQYDDDDIVVFLKDSLDIQKEGAYYETRTLKDTLRETAATGFGCVRGPAPGISSYHETETLYGFQIAGYDGVGAVKNSNEGFRGNHTTMGSWIHSLNLTLPSPVTDVCYGGNFAVTSKQIASVPAETFATIEVHLARGNNIQEGHYAERAWAGLLSRPLDVDKSLEMIKNSTFIKREQSGIYGAIGTGPYYAQRRLRGGGDRSRRRTSHMYRRRRGS